MIRMILATTLDNAIGVRGDLCVHSREDMEHFRQCTSGSTVIMGRKTWESLPHRPLKGRRNIVVTSGQIDGVECYGSLCEALQKVEDCWIIGGKSLFEEGIKYSDEVHLTRFTKICEEPDAVRIDDGFVQFLDEHFLIHPVKRIEDGHIFKAVRIPS